MDFERRDGAVILDVEDDEELVSSCPRFDTCVCRICHEEEESEGTTMEAPCACSGTLKFAHRGCVQRWCDEKGSSVCEICLQNFEPGYTVVPKKSLVDMGVTIRGSLEVARLEYQAPTSSDGELAEQCSPTSGERASCCRSVAVTFTIMLLLKHMISVVTLGTNDYDLSLLVVLILRAVGILLPFFCIMRVISALERMQRYHRQMDEADRAAEADDLRSQNPTIRVHL